MKILKTELAEKLGMVRGIVAKNSNHPTLQGVLISKGKMYANDLEICAIVDLDCEGEDELIIPSTMFELVNKLPDGEIKFEESETTIEISVGKIRSTFGRLNPELFAKPSIADEIEGIEVNGAELMEKIKRVFYAIDNKGSNSILGSLCMKSENGQMNLIAMNGYIVSWEKLPCDSDFEALLSRNAVSKILSIGIADKCKIARNDISFMIKADKCTVISQIVMGKYYQVEKVIPELSKHADIGRKILSEAVQRAYMNMGATKRAVVVRFAGRELEISLKSERGKYSEVLDLQNDFGEELTMGFNPVFLMETLRSFDSEDVEICVENEVKPAVLRAETNYRAVVLPMRIG